MKNETHVALANEILLVDPTHFFALRDNVDMVKFISWVEKVRSEIVAALQQVEAEALASKVVGPSDEEITDYALKDNCPCPACGEESGYAIFVDGAKYFRSQLTLAPNEQVIRVPNMQKIEKVMGGYITIEQQELLEYILPEIKRLNPQARIEESNE